MSNRAWLYIWGVLASGAVLSGIALAGPVPSASQWVTFAVLTVLATLAHLFKARGPSHEAWHANLVFLFAGVLLLPPFLFVFLVAIPHLVEWAKERIVNSPSLRSWYIQPFNIAGHIIAGLTASWVYVALQSTTNALPIPAIAPLLAALSAALAYVAMNHLLIGLALVLARGISWKQSGILQIENLVTDLILLLMGYSLAVLWQLNPWLVPPVVAPL